MPKGPVTVDGVSLTVNHVKGNSCSVFLIPHTMKITTLGSKRKGDEVNVEFDVLGKYALRAAEPRGTGGITEEFLKEKGF